MGRSQYQNAQKQGYNTKVFTTWSPKLYLYLEIYALTKKEASRITREYGSIFSSSCCCFLHELVFGLFWRPCNDSRPKLSKYMSQIERYQSLFASQRWYLCRSSTLFEGQRNHHNRRNGALTYVLFAAVMITARGMYPSHFLFCQFSSYCCFRFNFGNLKEAGRVDLIALWFDMEAIHLPLRGSPALPVKIHI